MHPSLRRLACAIALLVCAAGSVGAQATAFDPATLAGENGLWVRTVQGRLEVAWLTAPGHEGLLEVWQGNRRLRRSTTRSGQRHSVAFDAPRSLPVELRYGTADQPIELFRTTIHPDPVGRAQAVLPAVDSLYVVGDIHGERANLLRLLRNAGLVDGSGAWSGGRRHLVAVGDVVDRGNDALASLWLLYRLEHEAAAAGGGVHVVLGNHEIMVLGGDLRYTQPKELAVAQLHGVPYSRLFDVRESVLGRWLATLPGLMQVGDVLLAHGGVSPEFARMSIGAFNDSLATFIAEPLLARWSDTTLMVVQDSALAAQVRQIRPTADVLVMDSVSFARRSDFFFGENSVLWHRGYVQSDTLGAALGTVLSRYGARVHVVGHTTVRTIQVRYGGRLIAVDMEVPATELLLLERRGSAGYLGYRYRMEGPKEELGPLPQP